MAASLEDAILLAVKAHRGQKDKAGAPYVLHPFRIMLKMDTDIEKQVAVLHDVVEDTKISIQGLAKDGF